MRRLSGLLIRMFCLLVWGLGPTPLQLNDSHAFDAPQMVNVVNQGDPSRVVTADFNQDGLLDFATISFSNAARAARR